MCVEKSELLEFLNCIESDDVYYPELRDYEAYKELLKDKDSSLSKLVEELIANNSERSKVDLACTLAGAVNYLACKKRRERLTNETEEKVLEDARELFWDDDHSGVKLNKFVEENKEELNKLVRSQKNCPTIPQRAFPLAWYLPENGKVGVIELGCSRGDLGLALLNINEFLEESHVGGVSPYCFSQPTQGVVEQYRRVHSNGDVDKTYREFGAKIDENDGSGNSKNFPKRSRDDLLGFSRSIDKYYGVDVLKEEQTESDWLLVLWGLRDPRREVLKRFYERFKAKDSESFKRVVADALDVDKYLRDAFDFMTGVDKLVLFTSYMIYQLDMSQRRKLVEVARSIKEKCEEKKIDFYWYNQGSSVLEFFSKRELTFDSLYFSELKFNEKGRICGRNLARLADDCNSNWRELDNVVSDFLETIKEDRDSVPELRNYLAHVKLLKDEDSWLVKLIRRLVENQPNRSIVDLACTLAGAMNLLAYRESGTEAEETSDCLVRDADSFNSSENKNESIDYKELDSQENKENKENRSEIEYDTLEERVLKRAREKFWSGKRSGEDSANLDNFVKRYYNQLFDLTLSRTNCPTVPQRIFPLATYLPKEGSIGVIELGCSRGDLGLALLNPGRVLRPVSENEETSRYVFSEPSSEVCDSYRQTNPNGDISKAYRQFGKGFEIDAKPKSNGSDLESKKVKYPERSWREILRKSRPVDRYYGVDILEEKQTEPDWLLALWGLCDPRRKVLARFYRDFKIEESVFFKRVVADALDLGKYLGDALDFMAGVDNLVVFTSYMVYQLDIPQRFLLVDVVRHIKDAFETRFPGKKFYWFNQGSSVEHLFTKRELDFDSLYFSELNFNEANRICGRDIARLADDSNSNWRTPNILTLYGGPSRESLISVKSANTVIKNLSESGFSCSDIEIPMDVLEASSCVDSKRELQFNGNENEDERADKRVNAILKKYEDVNGKPDIVFPYLHGLYGEDGKIQKVLEDEQLKWKYVGCDSISSKLGMDKHLSKKIWNAQVPSREYWVEQENLKLLTTYEWDERLRRNPLWLFDRIKIMYDEEKQHWRVVKDASVDFSKASKEERDAFARRVFGKEAYDKISDDEWSDRLNELTDKMLRRWEYDVFIYDAEWNPEFEDSEFSFKEASSKMSSNAFMTSKDDSLDARIGNVKSFLNLNQEKTFIVERRYEAPVMTAPWILVGKGDDKVIIKKKIETFNKNSQEKLEGECILKPYNEGSSFDINSINAPPTKSTDASKQSESSKTLAEYEGLANSIYEKLQCLQDDTHEKWIVEKRLSGIDVTVSVLGSGDDLIVLPPLLIRPRGDMYDYKAKYFQEDSTYLFKMFPIQSAYLQTMKNIAAKAYRMLGCRDFARIDLLMVDDEEDKSKKRFYVLEANTMPGATVHSLTPKSAMEAGFSLPEFFRFVVDKALYRIGSNYATREIPGQDLREED